MCMLRGNPYPANQEHNLRVSAAGISVGVIGMPSATPKPLSEAESEHVNTTAFQKCGFLLLPTSYFWKCAFIMASVVSSQIVPALDSYSIWDILKLNLKTYFINQSNRRQQSIRSGKNKTIKNTMSSRDCFHTGSALIASNSVRSFQRHVITRNVFLRH